MVHGSEDVLSKVSASHYSTAFFRHALGNLLSADGRHPLDDHTRFFRLEVEKAVTSTSSEFIVQTVNVEFLQSPYHLLNI